MLLLLNCSFESDLCGFENGVVGQPWTRDSDGTPDIGTGPEDGEASADGRFHLYIQSSSLNNPRVEFGLDSPALAGNYSGVLLLSFYYNMFGPTSEIGDLAVQVRNHSTQEWSQAWFKTGNQVTGRGGGASSCCRLAAGKRRAQAQVGGHKRGRLWGEEAALRIVLHALPLSTGRRFYPPLLLLCGGCARCDSPGPGLEIRGP